MSIAPCSPPCSNDAGPCRAAPPVAVNLRLAPWLAPLPGRALRLARDMASGLMAHGCLEGAAALTYMTLFAMVPMMTVMYAVLALTPWADGYFEQMEALIFSHFVPQVGAQVQDWLHLFLAQSRRLSLPSLALLAVTAVLMMGGVERVFNRIWAAGRSRRLRGWLLYWLVLMLGPVLLAGGFAASLWLMARAAPAGGWGHLPWFISFCAFVFCYRLVPNCMVPWRCALGGGLFASLALVLAKSLFGVIAAHSGYVQIYGPLALVPLFMLWVWLFWVITLAGAELAHALGGR